MRKIIISIAIFLTGISGLFAQENIAAARALGVGQTVTVTGVVTNGDELGPIRYMQDATGGLAVYSNDLSGVNRGDEITVTGTLKDYNSLLEMDPVTSFTVNSTGNALPEAVELTPSQFDEAYEGMLVKVLNVDFDASGTFERKSYTFTAGEESGQMYVNSSSSPLVGVVIPNGEVTLVGPLGAYNNTYQLLPRDQFDMLSSSTINFTSVPILSNLSTSGFSVSWTTDVAGTTEAFYGNTTALESGKLSASGGSTNHSIDLSGLNAAELIYFQPFSVLGEDTAKSDIQVYITQSASSGEIKTYFNRSVDNSVSLGILDAYFLDHAVDDTLIKYINRAEESIDFTIYNFNNYGLSNISDALNDAYDRGVVVRVIYDSNIDAVGVESLKSGIGKIASPKSEYPLYGIMHNKFVVFDANSADPDKAIVWTGATNFTEGQMNTDPNNVIIVYDQSLAKTYQLEFNEMFGSASSTPDAANSKFGPDKADNTPHNFIIGGRQVECYFSPSDGTHSQILKTIETADHSIHIATMLITKTDIGYDLADKNDAGVDVKVLLNDYDDYGEQIVNTLKASLEDDIRLKGEPGIMHHKYMIVDQANADSDPILLTGCHNWSSSAQFRNDENTLVIHDQGVANAYYQEFVERFGNGVLVVPQPECKNDFVTMLGGSSYRYDVLYNDEIPSPVSITINKQPANGSAVIESDKTLTYTPASGFNNSIDTVGYKVCLESSPSICDSAYFVIYVNLPGAVDDYSLEKLVSVYPNPAKNMLYISSDASVNMRGVSIMDIAGRKVKDIALGNRMSEEINISDLISGIYFIRIEFEEGIVERKVVVE